MLPRSSRLNISQSFNFVVAGRRRETANLKIYYRFGDNIRALVGVALSKKVLAKATQRNQAKRLILSTIEKHYGLLRKDLNLVIMPKGQILGSTTQELDQEISNVKDIFKPN